VIPLLLASIMVCFLYIVVRNNTLAENLKADVVVATKEISKNTKISSDEVGEYFKVIAVDKDVVTARNYSSFSELPDGSFYVTEELIKGQLVYESNIEVSDFVMDKYSEEAVITSIDVSDFANSVCGKVRYGDIIDIYAVDPATDELIFVVGNIYVLEAYNSSGELLSTKEGTAMAFNILVMPDEIELINKAIAWEGIQIYKR
ncbi:MAG: hypothetical protein IKL07_01695, partial [Clostridium sp.]|nr:hypothetical protein [Clostridium sp.]